MKALKTMTIMNINRLLALTLALNAGQVTITIENQDQFLHLHNSYLLIEGDVLKADSTRYADADPVALASNGVIAVK